MSGSLKLKFLILTMRNFMSYGNATTTINLDVGGTTQIQGRNLDDTEQGIGANGVGKSTMINALVYVVYGSALSDVAVDDLINDVNKQDCVVSVTFSIGDDKYTITRYRKSKSGPESNYIEVLLNDQKVDHLNKANMTDINKWIIDLIGMPKELFVRLVVFDADEASFFKLDAAKQRTIMENLFQITALSEKADIVKEQNKKTKNELDMEENNIERLLESIKNHEQQLLKANQRLHAWENERRNDLDDYQNIITELSKIDIEYERNLIEQYQLVEKQVAELRPQVEKIKSERSLHLADIKQIQTSVSSLNQQLKTLSNDKTRLLSQSASLQKQIDILKDSKCPECGQHLASAHEQVSAKDQQCQQIIVQVEKVDTTVLDIQSQIENLEKEKTTIELLVADASEKIDIALQQITSILDSAVKPNYDSDSKLAVIGTKKQNILEKIKTLENETNPHTEVVADLQQIAPAQVEYDTINQLKKMVDHQTFLIKLLTDKKSFIRRNLIQKRLPYLNERLAKYLKQMGLPYIVEFNSDLTPTIKRRGKGLGFGNLSHGQKARVNFALSFAFRDILERMSRKINICMLDEVLDKALCGVGANAAVSMINEKAKEDNISIFIITHKSELSNRFTRQLIVTLENGFSSIQQ